MAESGGQPGNQNAIKAKRWSQAIDRALAKRCKGDGIAALDALAEKLLQQAEAGDMQALKELGDRIEGKPHQSVTADVTHSGLVEVLSRMSSSGHVSGTANDS